MPGWTAPEHLRPYGGSDPGRLESFELDSDILDDTRPVRVYLPAGYDRGDRVYPVLILTNGDPWIDLADLPNTLNHSSGESIEPLIAVFVSRPPASARDEFGGEKSEDYVRMLTEELVPRIDRRYRTRREPASRAIIGTGNAAMMAVYTALKRPDLFAEAGGFSLQLLDPLGSEILARIEDGHAPADVHFQIHWNRYELRREEWGLDLGGDSRRLVRAMRNAEYRIEGGEILDASGWFGWGAHIDRILEAFFAPEPES